MWGRGIILSYENNSDTVLFSKLEIKQSISVLFLFTYCFVNISINVLSMDKYFGFYFNAYDN